MENNWAYLLRTEITKSHLNNRICQHCGVKTSTVNPSFYYVFNIYLSCNINIPSFIGNLCWVLLLGNHLNRAGGLYGRILDEVVSTDRTQWGLYTRSRWRFLKCKIIDCFHLQDENSQWFCILVCNFFTSKRYRCRWENLDRGQYPFQPIKFVNLVVPNPC